MSVVCLMSRRGSPGVTLTALLLAASWPLGEGRRVVLVEADPAGGVLAARYGLGVEPGLASLAAASRAGHRGRGGGVWEYAQELPGGLGVVVGPVSAEQMHAVLDGAGESLAGWLAGLRGVEVVVDVGRFGPGSVTWPLVERADLVLMVSRPDAEHLVTSAVGLEIVAERGCGAEWVLVGDGPHSPVEVRDAYGFDVVGSLAWDPRGADAVRGGGSRRRIERSALWRSAVSLARDVQDRVRRQDVAALVEGGGQSPAIDAVLGPVRRGRVPGNRSGRGVVGDGVDTQSGLWWETGVDGEQEPEW